MSQLFVDTIRNRDGNGAPLFDKGVVITGIITASGSLGGDSVSIGVTEIISSSFELKNIAGLDTTTTATIESAIANAPNDFTSLNVSGISTFGSSIDLNSSIDIFGHTEINTLNASGILTATTLATGAEGSAIRISSNTISGPATLTIDPAGIGTNTGTVVIQGDLQVEGDTTTVNSTNLTIDDKNIILASGSLTDASSDGGGITLESGEGNKTINWVNSTDSWTFSENIDLAASKTFKINGVDILTATTLGSSVVNSSLTSVGTLTSLNVSGDLDVDGHTNLDNVNVSGVITATTFTGNLDATDVTGTLQTAAQPNITSVGTLTGLTVSGDIDVDGHTNLDNVSIAGVSTFASNINVSGDLDVDGHTNLDNVNVSGAITATIFTGSLSGNADTATTVTAGSQANITSLGTLTALNVSGDIDVDGHTNLDNVSISGIVTSAGGFSGNFYINESTDDDADYNITMLQTTGGGNAYKPVMVDNGGIEFNPSLNKLNLQGTPGVQIHGISGHVDAKNLYLTGIATATTINATTFVGSGDFVDLDVDGQTDLDHVAISGVSTFSNTINANGDLDVDGTTDLDVLNVAETATFSANIDANKSLDVAGNINALTFRAGISTYTGFVYDELDSDTDLRNGGDFNSITGVAFTGGGTDTLYWDFATASSVIGGEADNGISVIELANLPTNLSYHTRATLITFTDGSSDWDTGNVVLKVNGQTPTNYLWRNGAQPVGTTTGASNHFDIVEFKIVHDTNNEFSVFAEWQAYHATT